MLFVDFKVMVSDSTTTTLKVLLLSEFSFDMLHWEWPVLNYRVLRVMVAPDLPHDQHHGYHCPAVAAFFHIRNWCWLDQG